ncbi:hypothetical protein ABEB36_009411 [Hypothenemus hampei]|uniref:Uncharacterized protein n=1 Tax=Hypothenemus hampei TaxID=57062 RepID=A0ABD1EGW8_HYPHA
MQLNPSKLNSISVSFLRPSRIIISVFVRASFIPILPSSSLTIPNVWTAFLFNASDVSATTTTARSSARFHRVGPRTEPCGTPDVTFCFSFVLGKYLLTPDSSNASPILAQGAELKAFSTSNSVHTTQPLSEAKLIGVQGFSRSTNLADFQDVGNSPFTKHSFIVFSIISGNALPISFTSIGCIMSGPGAFLFFILSRATTISSLVNGLTSTSGIAMVFHTTSLCTGNNSDTMLLFHFRFPHDYSVALSPYVLV